MEFPRASLFAALSPTQDGALPRCRSGCDRIAVHLLIPMKTILRAFSVAVLLTLGARAATVAEPPNIRVFHSPNVLGAPAFYAKEKGLFEKHHVTVDLKRGEQANQMVGALMSGL